MNLSSGTDDKDDSFPLQQQLLVCTLILLCKNFKCKEVSLGKVSKLQYLLEQLKNIRASYSSIGYLNFSSVLLRYGEV